MIPAHLGIAGIHRLELGTDSRTLSLELLLDDGSIAATWWDLDDIHPRALAVAQATLDHKSEALIMVFALSDGGQEVQRWAYERLHEFMRVRAPSAEHRAHATLQ